MKDIIQFFPLRRYGAIALLFVFPLVSLYYFTTYIRLIDTSAKGKVFCQYDDVWLNLNFNIPKYFANNSTIKFHVQNLSPKPLESIKIVTRAESSQDNIFGTSVIVEDVVIDSLSGEQAEKRGASITALNMLDGDMIFVSFSVESQGKHIECNSYGDTYSTTFHQSYAFIISILENAYLVFPILFVFVIVVLSIIQDDNQEIHPLNNMGRIYIARIILRAFIILAISLFVLLIIIYTILDVGTSPYYFTQTVPNLLNPIPFLPNFALLCAVPERILTFFISKRPTEKKTVKLVIDKTGKEKEVEIKSLNASKTILKELWDEIISRKKK